MYKVSVLLVFGLLLFALPGCGGDPKDPAIAKVISLIGDVTSTYSSLKSDLNKAIDKAKRENAELTDADWKPLTIKAEELKKIAEEVKAYKAHLEKFRETTTEDQKKQLEKNYANKFREAVIDLDREERALEAALTKADQMTAAKDKEHVNAFRKELKAGKDVFELLTKAR